MGATPRTRKPRKEIAALRGELVSLALALTDGQRSECDARARLVGVSRRVYLAMCITDGIGALNEGEADLSDVIISENAAFLAIRVERDVLKKLDEIVAKLGSNRRWAATAAILLGMAERRRNGLDPKPDKTSAKNSVDERMARLERRMERAERIIAELTKQR